MPRTSGDKYFFSMELNPEKLEHREIIAILEACGNYKKSSFVQAAIRAYAGQQDMRAAIHESVKEAFALFGGQQHPAPIPTRKEAKMGKPYLQAAKSFVEKTEIGE